jgi:hypothetical protein
MFIDASFCLSSSKSHLGHLNNLPTRVFTTYLHRGRVREVFFGETFTTESLALQGGEEVSGIEYILTCSRVFNELPCTFNYPLLLMTPHAV